jgi:signal transduction histidine kinase
MCESGPIRILYIEDDRDLAALVQAQLRQAGYLVDLAYDGEEGLAKCAAGSYDLVAVDHSIPLRSGLEVIRILASKGPLPPTIMITGCGNEKTALETMKLGADDYIVKDTSGGWLSLLPNVIERVLKQRRLALEKQRAEEALRESEKLRVEWEKSAAIGRVAAQVAHEIRNPLASIKSGFHLIKDAVPKDHPHTRFIELIEKEIDRIDQILGRMIGLSRPKLGTVRDVCVEDIVGNVVAMLQPRCRERDLHLESHSDVTGVTVRIPEGSLQQVLYNLLVNALEASPPGGVIEIAATSVENTVQITVSDQGAGIPAKPGNLVFEPFFTTKSDNASGGLGLGLSISKGIVESLQGSLDFESEPGKKTVFRVIVPCQHR